MDSYTFGTTVSTNDIMLDAIEVHQMMDIFVHPTGCATLIIEDLKISNAESSRLISILDQKCT
jgi:hypothetical protein